MKSWLFEQTVKLAFHISDDEVSLREIYHQHNALSHISNASQVALVKTNMVRVLCIFCIVNA